MDDIPLRRNEVHWKMVGLKVVHSPEHRTPIQDCKPYEWLDKQMVYDIFKDGEYHGEYAAAMQHHDLQRQETGETMWFSFGKIGDDEARSKARKKLISDIMEVPELKDKYSVEFMDTDDAWFDVVIHLDRDKIRNERRKKAEAKNETV